MSNGNKPYVICHMLWSVDGRIKQNIWGFKDHHKYFEETAEKIKADAWLVKIFSQNYAIQVLTTMT